MLTFYESLFFIFWYEENLLSSLSFSLVSLILGQSDIRKSLIVWVNLNRVRERFVFPLRRLSAPIWSFPSLFVFYYKSPSYWDFHPLNSLIPLFQATRRQRNGKLKIRPEWERQFMNFLPIAIFEESECVDEKKGR